MALMNEFIEKKSKEGKMMIIRSNTTTVMPSCRIIHVFVFVSIITQCFCTNGNNNKKNHHFASVAAVEEIPNNGRNNNEERHRQRHHDHHGDRRHFSASKLRSPPSISSLPLLPTRKNNVSHDDDDTTTQISPPPPPPLTQIEDAAQYILQNGCHNIIIRQKKKPPSTLQKLLLRARRSTLSLHNSISTRRLMKRKLHDAAIENDILTTTRISGGADDATSSSSSSTTTTDQEQQESSSGDDGTSSSQQQQQQQQTATPKSRGNAFLRKFGGTSKKNLSPSTVAGQQRQNNPNLGTLQQTISNGYQAAKETSSKVGPSFISMLSILYQSEKGSISFLTLYALSLLGSSCGFHLFLYFITIGYALGITIPTTFALYVYNKHNQLSIPTIFHSALTIIWGIRLTTFLLRREYITWPALHTKVVELQSKIKISFLSQILCWIVYSFFYVAMVSMNWSRLSSSSSSSPETSWNILGYLGLVIQISGLIIESVADYQKNHFKSTKYNRHSWCNVGLWNWSTHPNYLGEGMFWYGNYLAHGFTSITKSIMATCGLVFITVVLKSSTRSLSIKQLDKYGENPDFCDFYRTHGVWGPKQRWLHGGRSKMEEVHTTLDPINNNITASDNNTTDTSTTKTAEEESSSNNGAQPVS